VGQVGDDGGVRRPLQQLGPARFERVAKVHIKASGIAIGDARQRRRTPLVALDSDDARGALEQQRAGEAPGPRSDLYNRAALQRGSLAGKAAREIEIGNEVLPEAVFRAQAELLNGLTQGRQAVGARTRRGLVGGAHVPALATRAVAMASASFKLSMKLRAEA